MVLGKVREVGERPTDGVVLAAPVPVKLIASPDNAGVVVTVTLPVRVPVFAGLKVTLIVHLAPAARLEPQVLVSAKLLLTATLLRVRATEPVLVRVEL